MKLLCLPLAVTTALVSIWFCSISSCVNGFETDGSVDKLKPPAAKYNMAGAHLKVSSYLSTPFLMRKDKTNRVQTAGHDYEGYVVDMLEELKKKLNFTYTIIPVRDERYGVKDSKTGKWNGMIGEVQRNEVNMSVAGLTITEERKLVVSFSDPFLSTGIGIMMRKNGQNRSLPLTVASVYLLAFTKELWAAIFATVTVVSVALFVTGRLSSCEWVSLKTSSGVYERRNNLSFYNSFWFVLGSLTLQNSKVSPRAVSTRVLAATWWFFCLVVVGCYIASLSAFLVHQMDRTPKDEISDVTDLARQFRIKYGTILGGSSLSFFKNSQVGLYQRMYANMESALPRVHVKSTDEAIERVKRGGYAALLEATTIRYQTERDCEVTQVGGLLNIRGYGIAFPLDSSYVTYFNWAIGELQSDNTLHKLDLKWWKEQGGALCVDDVQQEPPEDRFSFPLSSCVGIFIILMVGGILSFVIALFELFWKALRSSNQQGGSVYKEVAREAKFSLCGNDSSSPQSNRLSTQSENIILQ